MFALGAVDDGNEELDRFDEKTFASGTIFKLTHFRVNVRRRSAKDLGLAAVLGVAQGMYSVDGPGADASVPGPVTFVFGRGAEVRVGGGPSGSTSAIVSGIAILIVPCLTCVF
jgi:hypothetical protein